MVFQISEKGHISSNCVWKLGMILPLLPQVQTHATQIPSRFIITSLCWLSISQTLPPSKTQHRHASGSVCGKPYMETLARLAGFWEVRCALRLVLTSDRNLCSSGWTLLLPKGLLVLYSDRVFFLVPWLHWFFQKRLTTTLQLSWCVFCHKHFSIQEECMNKRTPVPIFVNNNKPQNEECGLECYHQNSASKVAAAAAAAPGQTCVQLWAQCTLMVQSYVQMHRRKRNRTSAGTQRTYTCSVRQCVPKRKVEEEKRAEISQQ